MKTILDKIREREERLGLKIVQNPFTLGATVIIVETSEVVYTGDDIACMVFVMKMDEMFSRDPNAHGSVATEVE